MKLNRNDYAIEATTDAGRGKDDGGYYAYLKSNIMCSAYGETPDEACENLANIVDDFVTDMYMVEEFV